MTELLYEGKFIYAYFDEEAEKVFLEATEFAEDLTPDEAFEMSVEKWTAVVQLHEQGYAQVEGALYWTTCGFCKVYFYSPQGDCIGCPVMDHTGNSACEGSPFEEYENAAEHYVEEPPTSEELKLLADAELSFIMSLKEDDDGE